MPNGWSIDRCRDRRVPQPGQRNPEHQALLHLIGTLVESSSVPGVAHSYRRREMSVATTRQDERLLEARDARSMQLRIIDWPALLFDTTGAVAVVRMHHRFIPLAVTYVLLLRPSAGTVARVGLGAIGDHLGPISIHRGASGWRGRDPC